jgi:hypothetical protein
MSINTKGSLREEAFWYFIIGNDYSMITFLDTELDPLVIDMI